MIIRDEYAMSVPTSLAARVQRCISDGEIEIPVLDAVALRVYREARSGELDAEGICDLLKRDPVLVGEVLRLANSGIFGGLVEVRSLRHAVVRLGTRQLSVLALSAGCKRLYSASGSRFRYRLHKLWRHMSSVGNGAYWLALHSEHRALADDVFVAGLLHDVGKLLVLRALEDMSERDGTNPTEREIDEVLAAVHCAQGAWLLERWGLPEMFLELVYRFEDEPPAVTDIALCLVRYVDRVCALEGIGDEHDPSIELDSLPASALFALSDDARKQLIDVLRA